VFAQSLQRLVVQGSLFHSISLYRPFQSLHSLHIPKDTAVFRISTFRPSSEHLRNRSILSSIPKFWWVARSHCHPQCPSSPPAASVHFHQRDVHYCALASIDAAPLAVKGSYCGQRTIERWEDKISIVAASPLHLLPLPIPFIVSIPSATPAFFTLLYTLSCHRL